MCDKIKENCRCHSAVMNGYRGMKRSGAAETEALDAAFRIYKFHHPEQQPETAHLTVERWIYASSTH